MQIELASAFLLGLLGSAHCVGMCGPIAIALAGGAPGRARFVAGRCLYNAGRVLTYVALGTAFGTFGQVLRVAGLQRWLSVAAGLAVLAGALAYAGLPVGWHPSGALVTWTDGMKRRWGRLFRRGTPGALLGVGVLNGLLPCGLVYAGLTGAVASGSASGGARFMLAFGLGTFPVMLAMSLAGHLLHAGFRRYARPLVPASLAVLGGLLILRGLGLGIPYLSPASDAKGESCCCHTAVQPK